MMGLLRTMLAIGVGCFVAVSLPRAGVLAATQELIGFLALLMAGLLPAMVVTATVLRGDGFSAKRLDAYGGALEAQLRFWAFLFAAAGIATLGVVAMKVFSQTGVSVRFSIGDRSFTEQDMISVAVGLFGAGTGLVMQRLWPAYEGLRSLLQLNVQMARAQALANDRSLADALQRDAANAVPPAAYGIRSVRSTRPSRSGQ